MRGVVVHAVVTSSTSSGAPCSMGGATFAHLAFLGSRCLFFAMKQSCKVLPN